MDAKPQIDALATQRHLRSRQAIDSQHIGDPIADRDDLIDLGHHVPKTSMAIAYQRGHAYRREWSAS